MKYMGSKRKISKYILPIILNNRKPEQWYVEPFCGGMNTMDKVEGNRIANDSNLYLIKMWAALCNGWIPPELITEDEYNHIKDFYKKEEGYLNDPAYVGYVGFNLSFGAKWFGGYRRDKKGQRGDVTNMQNQSRRAYDSVMEQVPKLQGVVFKNQDYRTIEIPENSIIYCDPPYENTTAYKDKFNHQEFWQWVRNKYKEGHSIFVSEYNAPSDFICVWEKEQTTLMDVSSKKQVTERLFIPDGTY